MSTRTINFTFKLAGVLTDATSAFLSDVAATFGVKRADTGAVVVAAGTPFGHMSTGTYSYTFTEPAPGLAYIYSVAITFNGQTVYQEGSLAALPLGLSYVALANAAAIAATLLPAQLTAWTAATDDQRSIALPLATTDIDRAMRYQGRKFDIVDQVLEFPRVPYESDEAWRFLSPVAPLWPFSGQVWDWDQSTQAPIIPHRVMQATLLQASDRLGGRRRELLDVQHDGMSQQQTGGQQQQYRAASPGLDTGLCLDAYLLMRYYRLRIGRAI